MEVTRRRLRGSRSRVHEHSRESELASRRGQEIRATCDERNSLTKIVNGDGELVRPLALAVPDQQVAALIGG